MSQGACTCKADLQEPVPVSKTTDTRQWSASKVNNTKARHSTLNCSVVWMISLLEGACSSRPGHVCKLQIAS